MEHALPQPVVRKLDPVGRYGLRLTLFAAALTLVAIPFGLLLHSVVTDGPFTVFDEGAAQWLNRHVHDIAGAIGALEAVSFLGKPIFLLLAVGPPGLWLLRKGKYHLVIFLAVTCIGGGVVDTLVKVAVGRPRPEVDQPVATAFGNSFPSGHSMSSVVCYGALLLVFLPVLAGVWRRVAVVITAVLVTLIGFSRLALGVHFVSDVVGGYVLGLAWLAGSVAIFEIYREDRGLRRTKPVEEGVEPEEAKELAS